MAVWFNQREIGGALGIYTVAPSLGRILALSTANAVVMPLTGYSWRLTLASYAAVAGLAAIIWTFLARDETPLPDEAAGAGHGRLSTAMLTTFGKLIRVRVVQVILAMTLGVFLYGHGFSDWLPEVLRTGGKTPTQAGLWASIPTLAGIVAALTIPRLTLPRIPVLLALFTLGLIAPYLIGFTQGGLQLLGLVLLGIRLGAMTPLLLMTLMSAPAVGPENMGAAGGMYFTTGEAGGVLGPVVVGLLADVSGDFGGGLMALSAVSGVLLLLTFVLRVMLMRSRPS